MTPSSSLSMDINDSPINVLKIDGQDYICLTDMAKSAGSDRALHSWIRTKNTIDFLGFWEQMYNPNFKVHEFVYFKTNAGANSFNPSIGEWIAGTNAKGIVARRGRYGGTYAHKDIAFEFGTWLSPEFKLLILTEYQHLKTRELQQQEWDSKRFLSKANYRLHTDAIKEALKRLNIPAHQQGFTYASEADMLNELVFGQTAADWRRGRGSAVASYENQRDYASVTQLVILANLESLNSMLLSQGKSQAERLRMLFAEGQRQYQALIKADEEGSAAAQLGDGNE